MKRGILGRADLLLVLQSGDAAQIEQIARQLGLARPQAQKKQPTVTPQVVPTPAPTPNIPHIAKRDLRPVPFWQATAYAQRENTTPTPETVLDDAPIEWTCRPQQAPELQPLSTQQALRPRLHKALNHKRSSKKLDVDQIVRKLGQGRLLQRLPYQHQCSWGNQIQIIDDRSDYMIPYWQDHDRFLRWLLPGYPAYAVQYASFREGLREPRLHGATSNTAYTIPPPGAVILILSDLGVLLQDQGQTTQHWLQFGRRFAAAGFRPLVLTPNAQRHSRHLHAVFNLLPWEKSALSTNDAQRREQLELLLTLVSPAIRIEPGFLRAVRLLVGAMDGGLESELWQHAALSSQSCVAATLHADAAKRLRAEFAGLPEALQKKVLHCLRNWRAKLPTMIWFEEVLSLQCDIRALCISPEDIQQSLAFFKQLSQKIRGVGDLHAAPGSTAWFGRAEKRFTQHVWRDPELGEDLKQLSWRLHKDDADFQPDYALDPADVADASLPLQKLYLHQQGANLLLSTAEQSNGSPLGCLPYRTQWLEYSTDEAAHSLNLHAPVQLEIALPTAASLCLRSDCAQLDLHTKHPHWADAVGRDATGLWAEIRIETDAQSVVQKLRYISPGQFLMGSPETEPGRYDDEGPQHPVTLTKGFWLLDTPVTQALWTAVMGDNPSQFKSPQRPVENVSWDDAQRFLHTINARYPALQLALPTEAQWEYACRAGTQTATYAGAIDIQGEHNAPVLDAIAWYGGNSGVDFELENGHDSSGWKEKQHDFAQTGSRPVAQKQENPWGLYDMLGNVWEWCADGQRTYTQAHETDIVGSLDGLRVIRGGSWYYIARGVRAAYRDVHQPDYRVDGLGFRCARVQA